MVVTDPAIIESMYLSELWTNYVEAMDAVIVFVRVDERKDALYYMAVAKASLDLYFSRIEDLVEVED